MPDPTTILIAIGAAFAVSLVALGIGVWCARRAGTAAVDIAWVLGIAAGFAVGCCLLGNIPHLPPAEDQDRLLLIVLPAIVAVEVLATIRKFPRWLIWPLRAALVAAVAPILLHGTSYLSDHDGPGTAEWSTGQACLILGALAALLAIVWSLLALLHVRAPGVSVPVCLAGVCAAAAGVVMVSGYVTGGQNGLAMTGAILGAAVLSGALRSSSRGARPLGVPVLILYSLVLIGHFFGELSSVHAVLLFASPLLAWIPELPVIRRLPRAVRDLARVLVVGAFVAAIVIVEFHHAAQHASDPAAPESGEATLKDYMNFQPAGDPAK